MQYVFVKENSKKKPAAESLKPEFRICCHKSAHATQRQSAQRALHRALPDDGQANPVAPSRQCKLVWLKQAPSQASGSDSGTSHATSQA